MVTLEELEKLSAHLGVTLKIDKTRNGRIWASKNNGHIMLSNKDFNTMTQEGANSKTTCTVAPRRSLVSRTTTTFDNSG